MLAISVDQKGLMMSDNDKRNNTYLQTALTPILVMGLTAIAVRWQLESKTYTDNIYALSAALSAIIVAGIDRLATYLKDKKIRHAETLSPGITKIKIPEGMELKVIRELNDPNTPDPPLVTEKLTKAGDIVEVTPMQNVKQFLFSGLCMSVMIVGLNCCSNMTPNEQYDLAKDGYKLKTLAYDGGILSGKLTPPASTIAHTNILNLYQDLVQAKAWLVNNAALANVPGIKIPSLDLRKRLFDALGTVVPNSLPNTGDFPPAPDRPAATQPS